MKELLNFLVEMTNSKTLSKTDERIFSTIFDFVEKDTIFRISCNYVNGENIDEFKKIALDATVAKEKLIFKLDEYDFSIAIQKDVLSKIYAYIFVIMPRYAMLEMPTNIALNFVDDMQKLVEELENSKRYIATCASAYYIYKTSFEKSGYEGIAKLKKLDSKSKKILGSSIFALLEEVRLLTDDDVINLTSNTSLLNDYSFENQINLIFDVCMEKNERLSEESIGEFNNISKSKRKIKDCTLYL